MEFVPRNFTTADLTAMFPNGPEYGGRWIQIYDSTRRTSRFFDLVGINPAVYREVDPVTKQPVGYSADDAFFLRSIGIDPQ